jgi:hypothetical protein
MAARLWRRIAIGRTVTARAVRRKVSTLPELRIAG